MATNPSVVPFTETGGGIIQFRGDWRKMDKFLQRHHEAVPMRSGLLAIGEFLARRMRVGVLSGRPAGRRLKPNAESTVRKKKSNKPLLDFHAMVNNIRAKAVNRARVDVGLFESTKHSDSRRNVAEIGNFHEFPGANFPTLPWRPFIHPVAKKEFEGRGFGRGSRLQSLFLREYERELHVKFALKLKR